ncbi:transposase [Escherichia coli]|nr:transposase [Escherichia coli]
MPRRQILSSEEQARLLVIPDDEIILTRMCFLSDKDIALINKHRRPANRLEPPRKSWRLNSLRKR